LAQEGISGLWSVSNWTSLPRVYSKIFPRPVLVLMSFSQLKVLSQYAIESQKQLGAFSPSAVAGEQHPSHTQKHLQ